MKRLFLLVLANVFLSIFVKSQIHQPDGLRIPGDWNSWVNNTAMGGNFDLKPLSVGTLRWQTTFQHTGESGNKNFKFVSTSYGDVWGNQWADNSSVELNQFENFNYSTNPAITNNSINISQNKWYTVVFEDKGYANSRAIFMETSAEPVDIEQVFQEPLIVDSQSDVDVSVKLSANPSPEEKFYLRYTIDNWENSTVIEMQMSGDEGEATITAQATGTSVEYYIFSTTVGNPAGDYDLITININNNGGSNYSYIVDQTIDCGQQVGVVTTLPAFPLEDAGVTIFFNAALGNGGLLNYDGDIYAHTGVITSESTGSSDWKYVKTEWGENSPETLLDSIGENLYKLNISNIREYYGVPANEDIIKMAFVFRGGVPNSQGNYPEHKNSDNTDIFIDVYELELNVKILSPSPKEPLASPNQLIAVCVEALENESLSIYLNNELLTTENVSSLSYPLVLQSSQAGTHWVKALASDGTSTVKDSVSIYLRGNVQIAELPEGLIDGVNYNDNGSVTLVLHDPAGLKQFAFAIGDYSSWMPSDENYMKRTPDGKRYWVTISDLESNIEYAYQYYVDGKLKIADPYTEKILDPWNDRWISTSTYPNLKQYPFDLTTGIVSIFEINRNEHQWEVEEFNPAAVNETQQDLVIYELLVRDFVESRSLLDVVEKLDYIQSIGVNAIQLMPIMEFDGNESWGYAPNFFFATDKYYGTRNAYKQFIDECHKRGMAVILDVVPNHAFGQNPMVQMYFDNEAGEHGQPSANNPWFNAQATHPYSVGYDFNHESGHTRNFFKRVFEYWLTEFKVDGFRLDLSKGLTQNYSGSDMGTWSAYDQSRINILTDYYNHIKSVNPKTYVILEHFAVNDEEKVLANTGMLLWSAMHNNYKQVAMGYQENSNISWAHHSSRGWNYPNLIDYMENHDEERLMFEALTYGNSSATHSLRDTITAVNQMEMAAVLFFGIPGPKMIWQFGELGYDYSIHYGGDRTSPKPPRWDYWESAERQKLQRVYNAMIQLRSSDSFRFGTFTHDLNGLGKRMWISHESMNVVIAANMGVSGFDMAPGFQHTGTWYDYFTGESIDVTNASGHSFYFNPGEYKVFTNKPLDRTFYNVNVTVLEAGTENPIDDALVSLTGSGSRLTKSDGTASFYSLSGNQFISIEKDGFESYELEVNVSEDISIDVYLTPESTSLESETSNTFKLYPNPSKGWLYVEAAPNTLLYIFDLQGRLVLTKKLDNQFSSIDISSLGSGIFIVKMQNNEVFGVKKLIISKP